MSTLPMNDLSSTRAPMSCSMRATSCAFASSGTPRRNRNPMRVVVARLGVFIRMLRLGLGAIVALADPAAQVKRRPEIGTRMRRLVRAQHRANAAEIGGAAEEIQVIEQ